MIPVGYDGGAVGLRGEAANLGESLGILSDYYPASVQQGDWELGLCASSDALDVIALAAEMAPGSDDCLIYFRDEIDGDAAVVLARGGKRALLFVPPGSRQMRMILARAARTLILRETLETGWLFVQAACAAFGSRGVALIGPKRTGKTTTLVSLVGAGWDFVTNDKAALKLRGEELIGRGFPVSAGVRSGTIEALPKVFGTPVAREVLAGYAPDAGGRLVLSPRDLASLGGSRVRTECEVRAFVTPVFDEPCAVATLELMSPCQAAATLHENRLDSLAALSRPLACLAGLWRPARPLSTIDDASNTSKLYYHAPFYVLRQGIQSNARAAQLLADLLA